MTQEKKQDIFVAYPLRYRISAVSPYVFTAAIALSLLYIAYELLLAPGSAHRFYPPIYNLGFFLLLLTVGIAGSVMVLQTTRESRRLLNRYRYSNALLEQYDPISRKCTSIKLDDIRLIYRILLSTSPTVKQVIEEMVITQDGNTMSVMTEHPNWPQVKDILKDIPVTIIPRNLWSARSRQKLEMNRVGKKSGTECITEQSSKDYKVPEENIGAFIFLGALLAAMPLLSGAISVAIGIFDLKRFLTGIPLSLLGTALVIFAYLYLNKHHNILRISDDSVAYRIGRSETSMMWDQISSIVLLEHQVSFKRSKTTSVLITDLDGGSIVIPGTTPDIENIIMHLLHYTSKPVFRITV